jgi:hypothetical protein
MAVVLAAAWIAPANAGVAEEATPAQARAIV